MDKLPWSADALSEIKHFKSNPNIEEGMRLVKKFEDTNDRTKRPSIQYDHLIAIANHEQYNVLQPLIYNNSTFKGWLIAQRNIPLKWISPTLKIVFAHTCKTDQSQLESIAPDDTILEDFNSRMKWITNVAGQFHRLRQGTRQNSDIAYMETELRTIAGWVGYKDSRDIL